MKPIHLLVGAIILSIVGVGCGHKKEDTKILDSEEKITLTLPDYDEANVSFGGGDELGWQSFPKRVDLKAINFGQLPKCGSGQRVHVKGVDLGLEQNWDDEVTEVVDVCAEPGLEMVAILATKKQLTTMPDGSEECLDNCDDSRFAIINLSKNEIEWSPSTTLGLHSEGWGSHCEIDRVLADGLEEQVLFYCGDGDNGMVSRWYTMVMGAGVEMPLRQVQWLESMTRQEYYVAKEELLGEFRRQKAFKPEFLN